VNERAAISVRARFERFPATVKGAFILRGEDPNPHQVAFRSARIVTVGGRGERPFAMPDNILDVAPRQDVFVPFELPVSDLEPGWYGLECELEVDGIPGSFDGGRRFAVPWPRATVRRGQVKVDEEVKLGDGSVLIVDQVECGGDSIKVLFAVEPPGPVTAQLSADGARLEVLDIEIDEVTGRGKVTAYPLLRTVAVLGTEWKARGRGEAGALDVHLP
jgi:hypothetical protein